VIDLHAHTNHSDGTDSPSELVRAAEEAGVSVLAITDHDTVSGWDEARLAAMASGIGLIPGIEVSTRAELPNGRGISVHILAYLPDPNFEPLMSKLSATRESRISRAKRMTELLAEDYPISWDEIVANIKPGSTVGRPALADALVRRGVVATRSEAFESILNRKSRYYVSELSLPTSEAIQLIAAAGGVSVMAHPLIDFPAGAAVEDLPRDHFQALIQDGLHGFEVNHRAVPEIARNWLKELAFEHNLIVTGSSDYHGVGGKDNRLGENETTPEMLERILDQATGFEAFL
jgi:predicted metal-dependent phosphoesterase TrpH